MCAFIITTTFRPYRRGRLSGFPRSDGRYTANYTGGVTDIGYWQLVIPEPGYWQLVDASRGATKCYRTYEAAAADLPAAREELRKEYGGAIGIDDAVAAIRIVSAVE